MENQDDRVLEYYFFTHGIRNVRYASPELISETLLHYTKLNETQRKALLVGYEKNKNKLYNLP